MRDIAKNIRQLRISQKMTQDELADKLFVTRQTVSNYETGKSRPDVEMLIRISEVLGTDIQQVIYGPEPVRLTRDTRRLIIGGVLTMMLLIAFQVWAPFVREYHHQTLIVGYTYLIQGTLRQLLWLCAGWTLAHLLGMALKRKPLTDSWVKYARRGLMTVLILWIAIAAGYAVMVGVCDWLYTHHIRGVWEETFYEVNGISYPTTSWSNLSLPTPQWFNNLAGTLLVWIVKYRPVLLLSGGGLWLLDFPKGRNGKM